MLTESSKHLSVCSGITECQATHFTLCVFDMHTVFETWWVDLCKKCNKHNSSTGSEVFFFNQKVLFLFPWHVLHFTSHI